MPHNLEEDNNSPRQKPRQVPRQILKLVLVIIYIVISARSLMNAADLPLNEPFTEFGNDEVKLKLQDALNVVNSECKDIPIVIGGKNYETNNVHFQVSVSY